MNDSNYHLGPIGIIKFIIRDFIFMAKFNLHPLCLALLGQHQLQFCEIALPMRLQPINFPRLWFQRAGFEQRAKKCPRFYQCGNKRRY